MSYSANSVLKAKGHFVNVFNNIIILLALVGYEVINVPVLVKSTFSRTLIGQLGGDKQTTIYPREKISCRFIVRNKIKFWSARFQFV